MNDLLGGHLPLQMGSVSFAHHFVLDGKAAGLAVGGKERHRLLPNIPTLTELGYPLVSSEWWILLAPAKTPQAVRDLVSAEMKEILRMPDVKARMPADDLGGSTPDELLQFMQNEQAVWARPRKMRAFTSARHPALRPLSPFCVEAIARPPIFFAAEENESSEVLLGARQESNGRSRRGTRSALR